MLEDPRTPLRRADLVVEWGAACKRGRVWPSTLRGVRWGAWYELSVRRRLPSVVFEPVPSVAAGLLAARRRPHQLVAERDVDAFDRLVGVGFAGGTAELRTALAPLVPRRVLNRALDRLGAPRTARARDLDAHQWAALFALTRIVRPAPPVH